MKERLNKFSVIVLMTLLSNVLANSGENKNPFAGESLPNGWTWKRANPEAWRLLNQGLEIKIEPGNMWGGKNDAKNVLLIPVAKDLQESGTDVQATLANSPTRRWEQVDLVWYYRDSHMVKIGLELVQGKNSVVMGREEDDRTRTIKIVPIERDEVTVRLKVTRGQVRGYYRLSARDKWTDVGTCEEPKPTGSSDKPQVSIQCYQGDPQNPHWARITGLKIDPVTETRTERDARMQWWREGRFGMFVHWGLYSGLAGTWKGKPVGDRGGMEWIQQRVRVDTWEYAHEAVPLFHPKEGFAREWAKLARQAGCRYVVFTTKHHDGFCLFNSKYTTYDAHDLIGRDLCKEIADAIRDEGLKVGFYHSVIDWHHPQYDYLKADQLPHPLKGKPSPNGPRNHDIYVDYLHHQAHELFSNYGPVGVIWWDYSKKGNEGSFWRADEVMAMARSLQPAIISNNRLYHIPHIEKEDSVDRLRTWKPEQGDFTTPEQTIPSTGIPGVDWEVCMTMNTTWGYSDHDHAWKSPETLIRNLVDIVSKGGNYLLNVGPKGDGSIPQESIDSMRTIGQWMATNGEAIYGTTASPFKRPSWGRYTKKAGKLYAHVFEWPGDGVLHVPFGELSVLRVYLLADSNRTLLRTEKRPDALTIHVPREAPNAIASVVAIEHK